MKIDISGLKEGEYLLNYSEPPDSINIEPYSSVDGYKIEIKITRTSNSIFLKIFVKCNVIFKCDRCLEDFKYELNCSFDLLYKYVFVKDDDTGEEDENVYYINPDTKYLDITESIHDYLLISVPMRKVPEEIDGKCVLCNKMIDEIISKNLKNDISPIWEKLKKINN